MYARATPRHPTHSSDDTADTASAYNEAGDDYLAYADGDPALLYAFDGTYAYGDRLVWELLDKLLRERRATGVQHVSLLDAGCGPGTWLRRMVVRAQALGFTSITARGFDIAEAQIKRARLLSRDLSASPGTSLTFDVGNLLTPLPEADASVDICLCLYGVLNHLPVGDLPKILAEFSRVTSGYFISTVRSAGSKPSIFVDALDKARDFKLDNSCDRCEIELQDGRHLTFDCHLFTAAEFSGTVIRYFSIETFRGLDLFYSRFAPDKRWNPPSVGISAPLAKHLSRLEERFSADPDFIDRAAHLLLVARSLKPRQRP